jgi:NAD(P)-dependent dehydrogenase (short-subunit alcohol dehydrogenase family)
MEFNPEILVTASSRGIGKYIATYLHHRGYEVVGTSRVPESYKLPYRLEYLDFRKKDSVINLVDKIGYVKGAVINTGNPSCEPCNFMDADYEDWIEAAQIFLAGPLYLLRQLLRETIKQNKAISVILISAASVIEPMPYFVVSDTVRSGLSRVVKMLSRTYPKNLRINALLLGSYDTPGAKYNISEIGREKGIPDKDLAWRKLVVEKNPGEKLGDPEELGRIVEFLLFGVSYINGTTILVDGSMTRGVLI